MRYVVAVVSDTHCNSTVGLMPELVTLDDGQEITQSEIQKWLWANWRDFWKRVHVYRKRNTKIIGLHNADMTDSDWKHATYQVITRNDAVIHDIAIGAMEPARAECDYWLQTRGTEAHTKPSAVLEEGVARELKAEKSPGGRYTWWDIDLELEGVLLNAHHHGSLSRIPWNRMNALGSQAHRLAETRRKLRRRPPDIALRSHVHMGADSYDCYPIRMVYTPCWQASTAFGYRVGADDLCEIGGVIIVIEDGKVRDLESVKYWPEGSKAWQPG